MLAACEKWLPGPLLLVERVPLACGRGTGHFPDAFRSESWLQKQGSENDFQ